jgi:hypothetical protein
MKNSKKTILNEDSIREILNEMEYLRKMIDEELESFVKEGSGANRIFQELEEKMPKIYLRPNNIIDLSKYSMTNIEDSFKDLGYEFRKEIDGKLHYFNTDTSVSLYLNPTNKKITLTP